MGNEKDNSSSSDMSFFDHLDALRPHLVRGGIAFVVLLFVALFAGDFIINTILMGPQSSDFPINRFLDWLAEVTGTDFFKRDSFQLNMINTALAGQFNLHMKISLVTSFALALPYLLWEIWQFIKPALTASELRGSHKFVFYVSLCFFVGLLFGYFILSPMTIGFLARYTVSEDIVNLIDINSYLNVVVNLSLACALIFQLPLLVYFLARMGVVTSGFMRKYRKHAIIILVVFAAIITPPDFISMTLVAIPLILLYEYGIKIAWKVERKKEFMEVENLVDETEGSE